MIQFLKQCGPLEYFFFGILALMFVGGIVGLSLLGPDPAMQPDNPASAR